MNLWLEYKKMDREFVSPLKCKVCKQFVDKIKSGRNFSLYCVHAVVNL